MRPLGSGDPLRLGPYRLLAVLGAGGMGQVYLGRDREGRRAAVKVLRRELAHDPHMAQRFLREASAARAVRSPGVARVLDMETGTGQLWIATEFLAGPTLSDAVGRHGPLDEDGVRGLGASLARTLADVHAAGLVHRDLKPPNIVLTSDGPRIIDFGIARPEHGLTLTSTGQAPATPGYAPPEQVLGRRTGPPADVFALGAVLAYASSGRPAFDAAHVAAVQYEVVHGTPHLDTVPPGIRAIVEPCLAKEPGLRPLPHQVASHLAPPQRAERSWTTGALAADIAEREAAARKLATVPGAVDVRHPGRRRFIGALAAGGAVLAVGGGTVAWWLSRDESADAASWAAAPLSTYRPGVAPEPLWTKPGAAATAPDSPGPLPVGDVVVTGATKGGLVAYDVRTGRQRWTASGVEAARGCLKTGDTVLAADGDGVLRALGATDGKERWRARVGAAVLLASDPEAVYVLTEDGRLRAVSTESRSARWTVPAPGRMTTKAPGRAVAGKDSRLVLSGPHGDVTALDTATGRAVWREPGQAAHALAPAVHDGTVYLGGRTLRALRLTDGDEQWSRKPPAGEAWGAPAASGSALYVTVGGEVQRRHTDGGDGWTAPYWKDDDNDPLTDAPVIQRNAVWTAVDSTGAQGISVVRADNGSQAWLYTPGTAGRWQMATAGNRLFLLQAGTLTAMPVF
ncbi:protein kinase domain-containing protein [Streptomyces sclerotialus]|uniref:protein kinase domain-containing protein n=1 Tax=Streptomyces sclerotialus TaxID=1957 RepID=UPI0004CC8CA9